MIVLKRELKCTLKKVNELKKFRRLTKTSAALEGIERLLLSARTVAAATILLISQVLNHFGHYCALFKLLYNILANNNRNNL